MLVRRAGIVARAEGFGAVENAYWWGARFDFLSTPETRAYVIALAGQHRCYPSTLGGTGSGCGSSRARWKAGATVLAGFELARARRRWSVGAEAGRRFVSAGTRSRWTFAATVRYRIF